MKNFSAHLINAVLLILAMATLCWGPPVLPPDPDPVPAWGDVAQWTILGGGALISIWRRIKK